MQYGKQLSSSPQEHRVCLAANRLSWPCSAISLPESAYPLYDALPPEVVAKGKLSQLQLEGVMYACTKHQELLPSGERARPRSCARLLWL